MAKFNPRLDIVDNPDSVLVHAELPGLTPEQVKVDINNDILMISGEKTDEHKVQEKDYTLTERQFGSFRRQITLGTNIDRDGISAQFTNGILKINVPKKPNSSSRSIDILWDKNGQEENKKE